MFFLCLTAQLFSQSLFPAFSWKLPGIFCPYPSTSSEYLWHMLWAKFLQQIIIHCFVRYRVSWYYSTLPTLPQLYVRFSKAASCHILTPHLLWSTYSASCWGEKANYFFSSDMPLYWGQILDKERDKLKIWMHSAKFLCIRSTKSYEWKNDACDVTLRRITVFFARRLLLQLFWVQVLGYH